MKYIYITIIETGNSDIQWDNFLSSLESSHYEQSICWARVKEYQGWKSIRIKVLNSFEWVAGAQILCKKLPFGGLIGYISCGPFYKYPDINALDILISSINQLAKENNIHYVVIKPYIENDNLDKLLIKYGYRPTCERLPPFSTISATLILDLSPDINTLFMDMRQEKRKKIRIAQKAGFIVRSGNEKDLTAFLN